MKSWKEIREKAQRSGQFTVSVAGAEDEMALGAVARAIQEGVCEALLFGDEKKVEIALDKLQVERKGLEVIDCATNDETARAAVLSVREGKSGALMKGRMPSRTLLKTALDKEQGLRSGALLSHVMATEADGRFFLVTDAGMNLYPDVRKKAAIIENAVRMAGRLGIEMPQVAPLCAGEAVNPDVQASADAAALAGMCTAHQIKDCIIDGPLALDTALSAEAARRRNISGAVAGNADILLVHDIDVGNIFAKALILFCKAQVGGVIAGATAPIILLSRADDDEAKYNSICLAKAMITN